MSNDENPEKRWRDFLIISANEKKLEGTENQIFIAYFEIKNGQGFQDRTQQSLANSFYRDKIESQCKNQAQALKSVQGYLTGIYKKFGFTGVSSNKQLFLWLNKEFKTYLLRQGSIEPIVFEPQQTNIDTPDVAISKILNDFLLHLNYTKEEGEFNAALETLERANIFLMEVRGSYTQRWLANRLIVKNKVFQEAASKRIEVNRNWREDIDLFWQYLANDKTYDRTEQPAILQKLFEQMQMEKSASSFCIAIYNIHTLTASDINRILEEFWIPFQKMIIDESAWDSKECLLLLMGNPGWINTLNNDASWLNLSHVDFVCNSLTENHLCQWLKFNNKCVYHFCEEISQKLEPDIFNFLGISIPPSPDRVVDETEEILQNIFTLLKIEKGFSELEQYWRI